MVYSMVQIGKKCDELAKEIISDERYEVTNFMEIDGKCVVDFKDRGYIIDVDWEPYCEESCRDFEYGTDEFNDCVDECLKDAKDIEEEAKLGSVVFWKDDLSLEEGAFPVPCEYVWGSEGIEEKLKEEGKIGEGESWYDYIEKIEKKFRELGCIVNTNWIHPHELVKTGYEVEEYPAVCYMHLSGGAKGECPLDKVLDKIRNFGELV